MRKRTLGRLEFPHPTSAHLGTYMRQLFEKMWSLLARLDNIN